MDTLAQVSPMQIGPIARQVVIDAGLKAGAIERIAIRDEAQWRALRMQDVTASVIGALVGVHDYTTPYALYAIKTGLTIDDPEESKAMRRGRLLEPVALQMLGEERPAWQVIPANDAYYRAPASRIGCTPDAFAIDSVRPGRGVVQVKTASDWAFRKKWFSEDGEVEVPLWIAAQTITEAYLTGSSWACVALLVVGNGLDLHIFDIPVHAPLWQRLRGEVAEFWQRVENGRPYDPDYARDGALLNRLYGHEDGTEIDLSGDNRIAEIVAERARLKVIEAAGGDAEKLRKQLDAEIIATLGSAQRGRLADGTLIAAKTVTVNHKAREAVTSSHRRITIKHTGEAA